MNIYVVWNWLSITLPTVAIAFCIWLCVRIVNRRERRMKWLALVVACLSLAYVLSFGPACWLISYIGVGPAQPNPPMRAADWIGLPYAPLGQIVLHTGQHGPVFIEQSLSWYAGVGIPKGKPVLIPYRPRHWMHDRDGIED